MSTATMTELRCAHCGKPVPHAGKETQPDPLGLIEKDRKGWGIYDVPHLDGTVRTVAVCPSCRFGTGRVEENHEPGTCGGHYTAPDAYVATCKEWGCKESWACWDKACVEDWQDEHFEEHYECDECNGHHNTRLTEPKRARA